MTWEKNLKQRDKLKSKILVCERKHKYIPVGWKCLECEREDARYGTNGKRLWRIPDNF